MALDAGIVGADVIHPCRAQDIVACRMRDMLAAWPMTNLASNIPLDDFLRVNIVSNRVAAIARWSRWSLEVIRRIVGLPPVGAFRDKIRPPHFSSHVPLCRLWVVVITNLREVTLLPDASIHQSDLLLAEFRDPIGG